MKKKNKQKKSIRRISDSELADFKAIVGPLAADYTDEELRYFHKDLQAMADILLEFYLLKQKNGGNLPEIEF